MRLRASERERIQRAIKRLARKGGNITPEQISNESALPIEKVLAALKR